jgi:hypothetical protein
MERARRYEWVFWRVGVLWGERMVRLEWVGGDER